jgi:dinuclear metal center YbgI/SA1388 family protein
MSVLTVADVLTQLDVVASFGKAAGWDPVGLQLGDPAAPVARLAVCHEVTADVVAAVEADPVDLLIAYHPLLFRPTTRIVAGNSASGRAFTLLTTGVALAVVHTAFDVAPGGAADSLAAAVGLTEVSGFGPMWGPDAVKIVVFVPHSGADEVAGAMVAAGAGTIGRYSGCSFRAEGVGTFLPEAGAVPATGAPGMLNREPEVRVEMIAPRSIVAGVVAALVAAHPYEEPAYDIFEVQANAGFVGRAGLIDGEPTLQELSELVTRRIGGKVRVAGSGSARMTRAAVVPGSGADFIAAAAGVADVLVTGDISHHQARGALDQGLAIIDPGHAATERPGIATLYAAVAQLEAVVVDLTHLDPSPWEEH